MRATVAPLLYSAEALASEDHDEAEELLLCIPKFNVNLDLQPLSRVVQCFLDHYESDGILRCNLQVSALFVSITNGRLGDRALRLKD